MSSRGRAVRTGAGRRGPLVPAAALAAAASLAAACLAVPTPALAQEGPTAAEPPEPEMARAPRQFRIAATAGGLIWEEREGENRVGDGGVFGLDVGRHVGPFVAFRLGMGAGRASIAPAAGTEADPTRATQYVADLVLVVRLAAGPLRRAGIVPFGDVGLAAIVHDPAAEDLGTKSQSAVAFGGGVEVDLSAGFGARAEWRRYRASLEDTFEPTDRTGRDRSADRFFGSLYLRF